MSERFTNRLLPTTWYEDQASWCREQGNDLLAKLVEDYPKLAEAVPLAEDYEDLANECENLSEQVEGFETHIDSLIETLEAIHNHLSRQEFEKAVKLVEMALNIEKDPV